MYDSPDFSRKIEKGIELHETSKEKIFERFGVHNMKELDDKIFEPAIRVMLNDNEWDFNDEELVPNKIKALLENCHEKMTDEEQFYINHMIWSWHQHATIMALRIYDIDDAKKFFAEASTFKAHHDDLTKILEFMTNGRIDSAQNYANHMEQPELKPDALEIIRDYTEGYKRNA